MLLLIDYILHQIDILIDRHLPGCIFPTDRAFRTFPNQSDAASLMLFDTYVHHKCICGEQDA